MEMSNPLLWLAVVGISVVGWVAMFGYLGQWVAHECGRNEREGFWLGILFGPLGLILEALLPRPK
jgi:hypothetical protein